MSEISLDDWAATVAKELGVDDLDVDVEQVLDLAADAAHAVLRPAAPVTTFVAGLAAGLAGGSATDIREALDAAMALCDRLEDEI